MLTIASLTKCQMREKMSQLQNMLLLVLIVFQVATLGPCTGHDFSPVFQAEANFHGEESSHARALALQRSKRAFYTADLQKTAEVFLTHNQICLKLAC
mgnify:CR=1 FL=1